MNTHTDIHTSHASGHHILEILHPTHVYKSVDCKFRTNSETQRMAASLASLTPAPLNWDSASQGTCHPASFPCFDLLISMTVAAGRHRVSVRRFHPSALDLLHLVRPHRPQDGHGHPGSWSYHGAGAHVIGPGKLLRLPFPLGDNI
jgi:hypothetical protein